MLTKEEYNTAFPSNFTGLRQDGPVCDFYLKHQVVRH